MTLRLLGFSASAGAAYIIESLTKVINFAFGFVPGTIGVYETGNGIILATLGYTTAIGLALAIVRKAAIIFWTVIGMLVLTVARRAECLGESAASQSASAKTCRQPRTFKHRASSRAHRGQHRGNRAGCLAGRVHCRSGARSFCASAAGAKRRSAPRFSCARPAHSDSAARNRSRSPSLMPTNWRVEGVRTAVPIGQSLDRSDSGFGSRLIEGIPFDQYAALNGLTDSRRTRAG